MDNKTIHNEPGSHNSPSILMFTACWDEEAGGGGIGTMVRGLAHALSGTAKVHVLQEHWAARRPTEKIVDGIETIALRLPEVFCWDRRIWPMFIRVVWVVSAFIHLRRVVKDIGCNVAHLHFVSSNQFYFRLLHMWGGPPYWVTLHGSDISLFPQRGWLQKRLILWVLSGAAGINAVSEQSAKQARQIFPGVGPIDAIHNGIASFVPNGADGSTDNEDTLIDLPEKFVLAAGGLTTVKGHDVLIDAWPHIAAAFPDVSLLLAGEGPNLGVYKEKARQLGCDRSIYFLGQVSNAAARNLMSRCLVLVNPSRNESFGYAILEAGMARTPVIATKVGGVPEIITDAETGLLVPPENSIALTEAVTKLLGDPTESHRLSENLYDRVSNQFSTTRMLEAYVAAYRSALVNSEPISRTPAEEEKSGDLASENNNKM